MNVLAVYTGNHANPLSARAQPESIYGWPDWRIILTIKQGEFSSIIMVCQRVTDLEILASCSRSLKLESSGYIVKDFSQILMQSA